MTKPKLDEVAIGLERLDDTSEWVKTRSVLRQLISKVESLSRDIIVCRGDLRSIGTELRKRRRARRRTDRKSR